MPTVEQQLTKFATNNPSHQNKINELIENLDKQIKVDDQDWRNRELKEQSIAIFQEHLEFCLEIKQNPLHRNSIIALGNIIINGASHPTTTISRPDTPPYFQLPSFKRIKQPQKKTQEQEVVKAIDQPIQITWIDDKGTHSGMVTRITKINDGTYKIVGHTGLTTPTGKTYDETLRGIFYHVYEQEVSLDHNTICSPKAGMAKAMADKAQELIIAAGFEIPSVSAAPSH